jgi:hypothetical protein
MIINLLDTILRRAKADHLEKLETSLNMVSAKHMPFPDSHFSASVFWSNPSTFRLISARNKLLGWVAAFAWLCSAGLKGKVKTTAALGTAFAIH